MATTSFESALARIEGIPASVEFAAECRTIEAMVIAPEVQQTYEGATVAQIKIYLCTSAKAHFASIIAAAYATADGVKGVDALLPNRLRLNAHVFQYNAAATAVYAAITCRR